MTINEIKRNLCGEDLLVIDKDSTAEDIKDDSIGIVYDLLQEIVDTYNKRQDKEISEKKYIDRIHSLMTEAEIFLITSDCD
jgi:hypothetical protein